MLMYISLLYTREILLQFARVCIAQIKLVFIYYVIVFSQHLPASLMSRLSDLCMHRISSKTTKDRILWELLELILSKYYHFPYFNQVYRTSSNVISSDGNAYMYDSHNIAITTGDLSQLISFIVLSLCHLLRSIGSQ